MTRIVPLLCCTFHPGYLYRIVHPTFFPTSSLVAVSFVSGNPVPTRSTA